MQIGSKRLLLMVCSLLVAAELFTSLTLTATTPSAAPSRAGGSASAPSISGWSGAADHVGGPIMIATLGSCLDTSGLPGSSVYFSRCDPNANDDGQQWAWTDGCRIVHIESGACLSGADPQAVRLGNLTGAGWVHANGAIKEDSVGRCLEGRGIGYAVAVRPCSTNVPGQRWLVHYW